MPASIERRPLTDLVISTIATATGFPVGDGVATQGMGWIGQPNTTGSNFTPYNIVVPGQALGSSGSFGDPQTEWRIPYNVAGYGVTRVQCEAICDKARHALSGMEHQTFSLGSDSYYVQQVWTDSIGSVSRIDQTDPAYWGELDGLTIWLSKEI